MENPEVVKIVKKYGDSLVITFNVDDQKFYKIEKGTKIKFKIIGVENNVE